MSSGSFSCVFFAEYTNCEYKWKPIPTNKCVRFQKKCCFYAILFGWDLWNMMYSVVLYNNWSLVTVLLRPAWLSWTTKAVEPFSFQPHLHSTSVDPHAQKELQLNSFFHRPPLKKPSFATKVTPGLASTMDNFNNRINSSMGPIKKLNSLLPF